MVHLGLGMLFEPAFRAFALAAFLKFLLCALYDMRLLLSVWKAHWRGSRDASWSFRCLCLNWYLLLFVGLFVTWELLVVLRHWIIFLVFSFWVPQLVLSVTQNAHRPFHRSFLIVYTLTHAYPPLYFLTYEGNFMGWPVHRSGFLPLLVQLWLVWYVGVGAGMMVQYQWGPRVGIPLWCLPRRYSYKRKFQSRQHGRSQESVVVVVEPPAGQSAQDAEDGEEECVICRTGVDTEDLASVMVTPCNHVFHERCLLQWMVYKMECPICRRALPEP
jgi:hypothetical protein